MRSVRRDTTSHGDPCIGRTFANNDCPPADRSDRPSAIAFRWATVDGRSHSGGLRSTADRTQVGFSPRLVEFRWATVDGRSRSGALRSAPGRDREAPTCVRTPAPRTDALRSAPGRVQVGYGRRPIALRWATVDGRSRSGALRSAPGRDRDAPTCARTPAPRTDTFSLEPRPPRGS